MSKPCCPECGRPLPAGSPDGSCPHCLLALGVPAGTSGPSRSDPQAGHAPGSAAREAPGQRIARYQLLEAIGEGGFGTVWMAEQTEPVRRKVALKIIKLGMDTSEVVARFEAERQALAMMDHPNIARVFDGGATENGRPYFVMELIKGVPITAYCDAKLLGTAERLRLFMQVCEAVQHAHQKGIIHRDLKPSNVLVTEQEGRAVPKVIDFGIAKATEQSLTEQTFFTRFNQVLGSPAYMSPEQAGLGSLDIDTRSDIYSLGVLLYELLTGRAPFPNDELLKAGLDEVLRTIRERDPLKPSTRLNTLSKEDLLAVAQRRSVEPLRLNRLVRGDLDWIAMKCLEKDRGRRYQTANGLAGDLQRHLGSEPVIARPPSASYRFQKAVRRNRLAFAAGSVVIAALLFGLAMSGLMYLREQAAAREQERLRKLAETNLQTARQAADRMFTRFAAELKDKPHLINLSRKLLEDALEFHQAFLQQRPESPELLHELAQTHGRVGEIYQLLGQFEKSLETRKRALPLLEELQRARPEAAQYREEMAALHAGIAFCYKCRDQWAQNLEWVRKQVGVLDGLERDFPNVPRYATESANAHLNLANATRGEEQIKEAEKAVAAYAQFRVRFPREPEDRWLDAQIQHWYGKALQDHQRLEEAERAYRKCHELRLLLAKEQPDLASPQMEVAHIKHYLGSLLIDTSRRDEGLTFLQEAAVIYEKVLEQFPEYPRRSKMACNNYQKLAEVLQASNRTQEAEAALRRAVEIHARAIALVPTETMHRYELYRTERMLGELLESTGRSEDGLQIFRRVVERLGEMSRQVPPPPAITWYQRDAFTRIATFYESQGRTNQAAEWRRQLAEFDAQRARSKTNSAGR